MDDVQVLKKLGTDARKWARKFNSVVRSTPVPYGEVEALGITYFANAIEAAREEQRQKDFEVELAALGVLWAALEYRCGSQSTTADWDWFPRMAEALELWTKAKALVTADPQAPDYKELREALR